MKQIIHINQHHIKWNRKNPQESPKPVITCKTYKDNQYHHGIDLVDNHGNVIGSAVGEFLEFPARFFRL